MIPWLLQATQTQEAGSDNEFVSYFCCLAIYLPLGLFSIWYWHRHYYVRSGFFAGILGALTAMLLLAIGIGIAAMVIDIFAKTITRRYDRIAPCPNCGKRKLAAKKPNQKPHEIQQRCPHCKEIVFQSFLTQEEWRILGF